MAYLGGKAIDDIVAGGYRTPAPLAAGPVSLRDALLASGRATDQKGLSAFESAVDLVLNMAGQHEILYAVVVIAAAQMRRVHNPYVTIVLPGGNLKTAVAKLGPKAAPFADAKGLTFNPVPAAVFAVDERDSAGSPDDRKLDFASTLLHEFTHVALARVFGNDSLPWHPGDERNTAGNAAAYERVRDLMNRFERNPAKVARPDFLATAGPWLLDRFNRILGDAHLPPSGADGKLNSESVPYFLEGTFLATCYGDWTLFFNSASISLSDYRTHLWPELLAGETMARGENTVLAPPYPGPAETL